MSLLNDSLIGMLLIFFVNRLYHVIAQSKWSAVLPNRGLCARNVILLPPSYGLSPPNDLERI